MNQGNLSNQLVPGAVVGSTTFAPITLTDIVRYQGASGDFQPIHHDPTFATRAGLEQPLVIGMLPAGLVAGWLTEKFGADNVRYFCVRWSAPLWPGDSLIAEATVAKLYDDAEGQKVDIEVSCKKQDSSTALSYVMTFVI